MMEKMNEYKGMGGGVRSYSSAARPLLFPLDTRSQNENGKPLTERTPNGR